MITEDYVSFEIAKLLKEKGFDAKCHSYYYPCHYPDGSIQYHKDMGATTIKNGSFYRIYSLKTLPEGHYLAPTLQMTMKWLRKVHNIDISVTPDRKTGYSVLIFKDKRLPFDTLDSYSIYEEACESAIKYCLDNLI